MRKILILFFLFSLAFTNYIIATVNFPVGSSFKGLFTMQDVPFDVTLTILSPEECSVAMNLNEKVAKFMTEVPEIPIQYMKYKIEGNYFIDEAGDKSEITDNGNKINLIIDNSKNTICTLTRTDIKKETSFLLSQKDINNFKDIIDSYVSSASMNGEVNLEELKRKLPPKEMTVYQSINGGFTCYYYKMSYSLFDIKIFNKKNELVAEGYNYSGDRNYRNEPTITEVDALSTTPYSIYMQTFHDGVNVNYCPNTKKNKVIRFGFPESRQPSGTEPSPYYYAFENKIEELQKQKAQKEAEALAELTRINGVTYNFVQEVPGKILDYINISDIEKVDSLTIIGLLDERDFKIINKMTDLKYLDLSNTYITYEPERRKAFKRDREARAAISQLLDQAVENKRKNGEWDEQRYKENKILTQLMVKSSEIKVDEDPCIMPTIENLSKLKTVKMPVLATRIWFSAFENCTALQEIDWPSELIRIDEGAFINTGLKELIFPSTLRTIALKSSRKENTFSDSKNITKVDFSKCVKMGLFNNIYQKNCNLGYFPENMPKLKEVWTAPTWKDIRIGNLYNNQNIDYYFPETVEKIYIEEYEAGKAPILHFLSSIPPSKFYIESNTTAKLKVYIPKGSLNDYYMAFDGNDKVEFIEN